MFSLTLLTTPVVPITMGTREGIVWYVAHRFAFAYLAFRAVIITYCNLNYNSLPVQEREVKDICFRDFSLDANDSVVATICWRTLTINSVPRRRTGV